MSVRAPQKAPSLSEYAYQEVKQRIQDGTFSPGSRLLTQDIADHLGISRTPVVAAVNRLAAEGYADAIPQQGIFVKKLSMKQIRDTLELRLMIEQYSVGMVIRNMVFNTDAVRDLREAAEGYRNIGNYDYNRAMEVECRFHQMIIALAENAEILRVYQTSRCVEIIYQMYRAAKLELRTVQNAYQEHERIVDLLEAGDQDGAKSLLEKHIRMPMDMVDWLISTGRSRGIFAS